MKPFDLPLLADENIDPEVVRALVTRQMDIVAVSAAKLNGRADVDVLRWAHHRNRVVLTHDGDFGTLAIRSGEPYTGVIYLRPGHISSGFVLEIIDSVRASDVDVVVPFILVAERKMNEIRLRLRQQP